MRFGQNEFPGWFVVIAVFLIVFFVSALIVFVNSALESIW